MSFNATNTTLRTYAKIICVAGYILTVALSVAIPTILLPEPTRTSYFWAKIGCLIFLSTAFWSAMAFALLPLSRHDGKQVPTAGVAPIISMVISLYCVASVLLLILQTILAEYATAVRLHLAGQVALFVFAVIVVMLLGLPVFFGRRNTDRS